MDRFEHDLRNALRRETPSDDFEAHLAALFSEEFRRYKGKVPGFVPRLTLGFGESFAFSQYLANKEYNTALGFAGALAVMVVKLWRS